MRTLAVLPVKSFAAAKQRLSESLGTGARRALAQAMASDVLTALRHVRGLDAIVVVTADRGLEHVAAGGRVRVLRDRDEAGQSAAAGLGISLALAEGFERVLLVPGDTPLLATSDLEELLQRAEQRRLAAVIVPDRHGTGTNGLLLTPPDAIEPSFGPGSLERHVTAAREAGIAFAVDPISSLLLDVDTPDDLATLSAGLGGRHGAAPLTRGALSQLGRARAPDRAPVSA